MGRQRTRASQSRVLRDGPTLKTGDQSATANVRGQWIELPDTQLSRELGDSGRRELPSS